MAGTADQQPGTSRSAHSNQKGTLIITVITPKNDGPLWVSFLNLSTVIINDGELVAAMQKDTH